MMMIGSSSRDDGRAQLLPPWRAAKAHIVRWVAFISLFSVEIVPLSAARCMSVVKAQIIVADPQQHVRDCDDMAC